MKPIYLFSTEIKASHRIGAKVMYNKAQASHIEMHPNALNPQYQQEAMNRVDYPIDS